MTKYFIDSCIWIDLIEDRKGFKGEPLGMYSYNMLMNIIRRNHTIAVCSTLLKELSKRYGEEKLNNIFLPFAKIMNVVQVKDGQIIEAVYLARERNVPENDALFAVLCRDMNIILVTRDKDFQKLRDIISSARPEDLFRVP